MAIVYQHIRKDTNEVFYIGIGKTIARSKSKVGRNNYWYHIVDKVSYEIEIIHNNISWEEACELEKFYIKKYGRKDLGLGLLVNMTDGGEGVVNKIVTDETRKKLSKLRIGKPAPNKGVPQTLEHREKTSKTRIERGVAKGEKNPMYGKKGSLCPHYGKKRPEHSLALKGKPKPEGFSEKCRLNKQGEKNILSKLKDEDVRYIRLVYKKADKEYGATPLSIKYAVSISLITDIVNYKRWKHI